MDNKPEQPNLSAPPKEISEISLLPPKGGEPKPAKSVNSTATGISFQKSVIIDIHHARERLLNFYSEVLRDNNHARLMIADGTLHDIPNFRKLTDKDLADHFGKMALGDVLLEECPDCDMAMVNVPSYGNVLVAEKGKKLPSEKTKAKSW